MTRNSIFLLMSKMPCVFFYPSNPTIPLAEESFFCIRFKNRVIHVISTWKGIWPLSVCFMTHHICVWWPQYRSGLSTSNRALLMDLWITDMVVYISLSCSVLLASLLGSKCNDPVIILLRGPGIDFSSILVCM